MRKFHLILWLRQYVYWLRWSHIALAVVTHMFITYGLFALAGGEEHLIGSNIKFFYFSVVTYSTTGYGDLSPVTEMGMLVGGIWVIPFGILLYGAFFAKGIEFVAAIRDRRLKGEIDVDAENHIVLLGWNKNTVHMINLILADEHHDKSSPIVLGVIDDITNPCLDFPEVKFVKLESYTSDSALERVSINKAAKVIINGSGDDENFVIGVHLTGLENKPHISTYFNDPSKAESLRRINNKIECSCDMVAEMLTRTMQDHGSSVVITKLADMSDDATTMVYKLVPKTNTVITMGELREHFWKVYGAAITGISFQETGNDLELIPNDGKEVYRTAYVHYIGKKRIMDDIAMALMPVSQAA